MSKSRRRRPPVGPCRGVRARARQNDGMRAVLGPNPTIRRRPADGPRRRFRLRAGPSAKNPSRRGVRTGGPRHRSNPSRHRNSSGPGRRLLLSLPAIETRFPAGNQWAPRDSGCQPGHQAAIGLPILATTAAPGLGCTTMLRPATALRSARPASAKRRRPQCRRLIGGAGIPARPNRREARARRPVIPVKTPNTPTPVSRETRRQHRQCRLHRLRCHRRRRHRRRPPTDPTGARRCRHRPRRRWRGIAAPIRTPKARHPAANRSPSCWHVCKRARPGAAGADAARTEANATAHLVAAAVKS